MISTETPNNGHCKGDTLFAVEDARFGHAIITQEAFHAIGCSMLAALALNAVLRIEAFELMPGTFLVLHVNNLKVVWRRAKYHGLTKRTDTALLEPTRIDTDNRQSTISTLFAVVSSVKQVD